MKPPTCMIGVPSGAASLHGHWMLPFVEQA
jgi:hypothetical protein